MTFFDASTDGHVPAGVASEEWDVAGCDVDGALRWVREHADARTWTLHLLVPADGVHVTRPGLVWLTGTDPNAGNAVSFLPGEEEQER